MGEAVFRAGVNERGRLGADADDFAARMGRFVIGCPALRESRACHRGAAGPDAHLRRLSRKPHFPLRADVLGSGQPPAASLPQSGKTSRLASSRGRFT
jgi:hypothetical protein